MFEGELKASRTQAHTASRAMERLRGPITPYIFGERQNVDCLEDLNYASSWGLGESHLSNWVSFYNPNLSDSSSKSFHERMPSIGFLQMLEQARSPIAASSPLFPTDHNLNMLLRLPQKLNYLTEMDSRIQGTELESCITHVSEAQSPVKSETNKDQNPLTSRADEVGSSANQEPNSPEICKDGTSGCSTWLLNPTQQTKPPLSRRKRKRLKPSKNSEEVESQRMTHIAVERNRRKQMNEHLSALRSLMPTSFIQRGDQASIIGGAIDFVKELEQLLQSLQAQKRRRQSENGYSPDSSVPFNGFFLSPQYTTYSSQCNLKYVLDNYIEHGGNEFTAENKSALADIEVTLIQTHANLKVLSERRPGQLVKAIAALENLKLTILHLNITSLERSVLYSFNLKIEEDCKFRSADEIATAVHQIFSLINGS